MTAQGNFEKVMMPKTRKESILFLRARKDVAKGRVRNKIAFVHGSGDHVKHWRTKLARIAFREGDPVRPTNSAGQAPEH